MMLGFKSFLGNLFGFTKQQRSHVKFTNLNDKYVQDSIDFCLSVGKEPNVKENLLKHPADQKKLFILDFNGDVMASTTNELEKEITAIIINAKENDEVLIRLESPGGAAFAYGLAASQIERLKKAKLKVTVAVDRVAASGGYMMAVVADKIIAAPFAMVGSIGVVAEFPNFAKILRSIGVDYKQYTAGKYKRTVGTMSEISIDAEKKFEEDLLKMYSKFKQHIVRHRNSVDIDSVATGETWSGDEALEKGLIDSVQTAEEYIFDKIFKDSMIPLLVSFVKPKKSMADSLFSGGFEGVMDTFLDKVISKIENKLSENVSLKIK